MKTFRMPIDDKELTDNTRETLRRRGINLADKLLDLAESNEAVEPKISADIYKFLVTFVEPRYKAKEAPTPPVAPRFVRPRPLPDANGSLLPWPAKDCVEKPVEDIAVNDGPLCRPDYE
jgi:hypothetical protein